MAYVRALYSLLVAVAIAAVASCTGGTSSVAKLSTVAALPKPSLPPWITSISPTRTAQTLAQIRVIFAKPVTPVEALSGEGPRDVLDRVSIEPELAGHFVVLTPRMIGFVADRALPVGTRVRVTLAAGLHDLSGDVLKQDLAWTFETQALSFTSLPQLTAGDDESTPAPVGLQPKLQITSNAAVDVASLAAHAELDGTDGSTAGVTAVLEATPSPSPGDNAQELYDPSLNDWVYDLLPARKLRRAATYRLAIAPGVEPLYGNLATTNRFLGGVRTYDVLAIVPTPAPSPNGGGRFADGDPAIVFSNPLDPDSVANAVTISPAPAAVKALTSVSDQSNTIAINPYALDPDKTYVATVAASVKDVFGQTLGHEQRVTIRTSDFAPGAWAPSGGPSVIPAGASVDLNFYATNLPGDAYRTGYARLTPLQMLGSRDPLTLLPPWRSWPSTALRGARRNVQSVVRFPVQS
ncbi:MAG: Ig-like domain-containing protein, partial [Candidatus Cybelea sp.]